jgi:O-glycosyl hydrolase
MTKYSNSFAGVAFHCYAGQAVQQSDFHKAHPNKEIYFTGPYSGPCT